MPGKWPNASPPDTPVSSRLGAETWANQRATARHESQMAHRVTVSEEPQSEPETSPAFQGFSSPEVTRRNDPPDLSPLSALLLEDSPFPPGALTFHLAPQTPPTAAPRQLAVQPAAWGRHRGTRRRGRGGGRGAANSAPPEPEPEKEPEPDLNDTNDEEPDDSDDEDFTPVVTPPPPSPGDPPRGT